MQYVQEYDETMPPQYIKPTGGNVFWPQLVQPYIKSTQVFQCPSDSDNSALSFATNPAPAGFPNPAHFSYARNTYTAGPTLNSDGTHPSNLEDAPGPRLAQFVSPTTTVLMTDKGAQTSATAYADGTYVDNTTEKPGCAFLTDPRDQSSTTNDPNWCGPKARHLETANVAFCDGHVKSLRLSSFYYPNSPWLQPDKGGN